jgi:hypothetical protein
LAELSSLCGQEIKNAQAAKLYGKLADFNTEMSFKSLKVGATLNEFLNKELKY